MEAIVSKKTRRKTVEGKESAFTLRGLRVDDAKIDRYLRRKRKLSALPAPGKDFGNQYHHSAISIPKLIATLETPIALTCFTPPPGHGLSKLQMNQPPSVPSSYAAFSEAAILPSQSLGYFDHYQENPLISSVSSWWSPRSYLPLHGFDDSRFYGTARDEDPLQRIISRLCALGSKESYSPAVSSQGSQRTLPVSTAASNYERFIMDPFLLKMDELSSKAEGLNFKKNRPGK
jgi:hypothetical protein